MFIVSLQFLHFSPSGLFASDNFKYNLEKPDTQPTLEEMTRKAIKILSKESKGYFLFVEGGLIDYAHHNNTAAFALDETVEMSKAVAAAVNMTREKDTLIVVTSDHAHTMMMSGYSKRNHNILGKSPLLLLLVRVVITGAVSNSGWLLRMRVSERLF